MLTINGTPLTELISQVLCFEHLVHHTEDGTTKNNNTRVEILLDKTKVQEALSPFIGT
jgi:hypothetical protein